MKIIVYKTDMQKGNQILIEHKIAQRRSAAER